MADMIMSRDRSVGIQLSYLQYPQPYFFHVLDNLGVVTMRVSLAGSRGALKYVQSNKTLMEYVIPKGLLDSKRMTIPLCRITFSYSFCSLLQ